MDVPVFGQTAGRPKAAGANAGAGPPLAAGGYRRLIVLLPREGILVNHTKAYRIYTEEDLKVRRKQKKIRSRVRTAPLPLPSKTNEQWSTDLMQDCLADGRRFRVLTIVNDFTRECHAVEVDSSIPGARGAGYRLLGRPDVIEETAVLSAQSVKGDLFSIIVGRNYCCHEWLCRNSGFLATHLGL